jgi:hypothetical protein
MNAILGLIVPALLGVDFGWERRADGTIEYIVQVDPESFTEMQKTGQSISSALPHSLRDKVSDLSFRVGRDKLPNQNTLPPDVPSLPTSTPAAPLAAPALPSNLPPNPFNTSPPPTFDAVAAPVAPVPTPTPQYMTNGYQPSGSFAPNSSSGTGVTSSSPSGAWPTNGAAPPSSTFPANPNAPPPSATIGNAGSPPSLPTNTGRYANPADNMTSSPSGAWPTNTAPPSLSTGPRVVQPQPWSTPPREVAISAKPPLDPNGYATVAANPNAPTNPNPAGPALGNPFGQQGFNPQPPQYNPQYAQSGYAPPGVQQQQPIYAAAAGQPNGGQPNMNPPPMGQPQPGQPMQPAPGMPQQFAGQPNANVPHDQYFNRVAEPRSASALPTNGTLNVNQPDQQWLPLTLVLIGFLTSLASNFYFGWSTYQLRERYRLLLVDRGAY